MKLLIVIINYRTGGLTVDCLRSLASEVATIAGVRAVVTDNASGDGSIDRVAAAIAREGWSWASTLPLPRNGGFAYGNNQAVRAARAAGERPQYVLLLNPDTIVRPGGVAELLAFMEAHPAVGLAGSRLEDPDGTPQRSAFRFPSVPGELDDGLKFGPASKLLARRVIAPPPPVAACRCDWVAGASLMIRGRVFDDIGLLDEGYFMYFEETDFCHRAAKAGWPCWYVPASRVVHLVGQSSGVTDPRNRRARRPAYWFESRRRYYVRHHGPAYAALADLAWAAGHLLWQLRRTLQRKPDDTPRRMLADLLRHSVIYRRLGRGGQIRGTGGRATGGLPAGVCGSPKGNTGGQAASGAGIGPKASAPALVPKGAQPA